jgi:hypothetical protein
LRLPAPDLLAPWAAAGALEVPDPVPIVSPVVPLFMAPLLMPPPGLGRVVPVEAPLAGGVAGDTAASPDVVVEPVLAFCASANELVKITTDTAAITASFISIS